MKRIPRPVLRALEALAQSPINTSALAISPTTPSTAALGQPLAFFFELSLKLCRDLGGLERGYLILDDVPIQRYRSGRLGLRKMRDTATGGWAYGLSLVVLAWTDGKRRIPLAFLPYFGEEESKLDLALALLEWAKEAGFRPEGVLFDAWYAARQVLEWLHAHGWSLPRGCSSVGGSFTGRTGRGGGTRGCGGFTGCGRPLRKYSGGCSRSLGGGGTGTGGRGSYWRTWRWGWWPTG